MLFRKLEKDFTRKQFIKNGHAKLIMDHMIEREKTNYMYDFIMKSHDDILREKEEKSTIISEEINDSIR